MMGIVLMEDRVDWQAANGSSNRHFFMSELFRLNGSGHYPQDNILITVYFWQLLLTISN